MFRPPWPVRPTLPGVRVMAATSPSPKVPGPPTSSFQPLGACPAGPAKLSPQTRAQRTGPGLPVASVTATATAATTTTRQAAMTGTRPAQPAQERVFVFGRRDHYPRVRHQYPSRADEDRIETQIGDLG